MKQVPIQPVPLHRLLVPQQIEAIEVDRDFALLKCKRGDIRVDLGSATLASSSNWLKLHKVTLTTPHGVFSLAGLPVGASAVLEAAVKDAHRRKSLLFSLFEQTNQIREVLTTWEALEARDAYLTDSEARSWRANAPPLNLPTDADADLFARLPMEHQRSVRRMAALKKEPQKVAEQRNAHYCRQQLDKFKPFFDRVESNPLTEQQRQAIVHDEDNALVIAGAGTGKTSTVVGKVGFILKKGWASPDEILLLAFTTKAADEMRERIAKKLGADVKVRTFHGLGLEIIAQARGKKPSLFSEAEDRSARERIVKGLITDLVADDGFRQDLLAFQSSLRRPYRPAWEFKTEAEYTQYLLDVEPRALNGRLLKSYEECEIANWLTTHGVAFEYERPYEIDTATADYRQYRPDFYLPEQGIYIEHLGVDRSSNPAPFMDRQRYLDKMKWARELHAEHGTKLVETYSWEKGEGVLLSSLEAKLRAHGVVPRPIPTEEALRLLNEKGQIDPLARLVGTFLGLLKSAGHTVVEMRARADRGGDPVRAARFLGLFGRLFESYEALLRGNGEIDFDDMITLARGHVVDGTYGSKFRYILVDEFQDISAGRAGLVRALRNQVKGAKLFCVGDDWQSIYRFTGSDIALTTEFEKHFGPTRKTALDRTFRFHDRIAAFSSRFVQQNPSQLRKQLSTSSASDQPGVVMYTRGEGDDPLPTILAEIAAQGTASVFLLGRYTFSAPDDLKTLQARFPRLNIRSLTAHGSKGLEADYVVILGLSSGKYGFPSEIADDPVLGMVLADGEQFAFAEERRLFYVALTRARKRVYLVSDAASPSAFVREVLADDGYEKKEVGSAPATSDACPACKRGRVMKREGEFGLFYSCSNQPICTFKGAVCSRCGRGRMRDDGGEAICSACGFKGRVCPKCGTGVLVIKKSRKSGHPFWGCSNYGRDAERCGFTEPMAMGARSVSAAGRQ